MPREVPFFMRVGEILDIFVGPPLAMIPAETVDQIMNAAVIEEVVGDYVELKKSGSALRG